MRTGRVAALVGVNLLRLLVTGAFVMRLSVRVL